MIRVDVRNLQNMKDELMGKWKINEEQWKVFYHLATKKTWLDYHKRGYHYSFAKRDYTNLVSEAINGSGAESLYPEMPHVHYVNMGDPYVTTAILKGEKLYIGCWGRFNGIGV